MRWRRFSHCGDGARTIEAAPFSFFFLTRVNHGRSAADTKSQFSRRFASASASLAGRRSHIKSSGSVITFSPRSGVWAPVPASPPDERTVWGRRSNLNSANTAARLFFPRRLCLVSSGGLGIVRAVKSRRATSSQWGRILKSPESSVALQVYTCISRFF